MKKVNLLPRIKKDERSLSKRIFTTVKITTKVKTRQKATGLVKMPLFKAIAKVKKQQK